jgi:hypothetical protein
VRWCGKPSADVRLALIPGTHEGYVSWEEFEQIQRVVQQNNQGEPQPGAARNGQSLLAGLLRCRRCGRKLTVRCTGNEASVLAHQERARQRDDVVEALERDREAARYAVDPENRLVTAELERRWNLALQHLQAIEGRIEQHSAAIDQAPATSGEDLHQLANQLKSIWPDPATSARLKKRIVRTFIEEVLVDIDSSQAERILTLHWKGGVHTELRLPRRRRGQCSTQTSRELIDAITVLARIASDDMIASVLNPNGHLTGRGNRWTRERVTALHSHHRIPCHKPDEQQPWINLTDAAALLDISPRTLRLAIDRRGTAYALSLCC